MYINKKNIFPIIIPTLNYHDRFNNQNSYVEMNPSLYINPDGSFIILVRTINYLKHQNKSFTVYENSSISLYSVMRGKIEDNFNLDNAEVKNIEVQYNIQRYKSLWYGVEDIRFIDENTILACIPECNNGSPCIFKGKLNENVISSFEKCNPSVCEKNWMPFDQKVIYSVSPFVIKSILENDMEEIKCDLNGWHGSSNGIDFLGDKLFLIHKNNDRVYNKWLRFNPNTKKITYSNDFVFFKDSYLEFTCSLAKYKERIFVSVGVNDNKAFIVEIEKDVILKLFPF